MMGMVSERGPRAPLSCPGLTGASSTPRQMPQERALQRRPLEYWIARLNRAMTVECLANGLAKRATDVAPIMLPPRSIG